MCSVPTDLSIKMPSGSYFGRIAEISTLAYRNNCFVVGNIVPASMRGNIRVLLYNLGESFCYIPMGSKIAQIVFEKAVKPELVCV